MIKDISASVRQRLLNLAKERQEDFNFVLQRYGIERLLYRLSISEYKDKFVLKGATLFSIWNDEPHRPTKDIDFLSFCDNDLAQIKEAFISVSRVPVEDGIIFDESSVSVEEIKDDAEYNGVRVKLIGYVKNSKANIQVDIGFGDIMVPEAEESKLPTLLEYPAPNLRTYPVYSVISEKLQAMYSLGEANSRMKDFYDLWNISKNKKLNEKLLHDAVMATFNNRDTEFTSTPIIFENEFIQDVERGKMWKAYLKKLNVPGLAFSEVINEIKVLVTKVDTYKNR